jgi:hypothetical protein
MPSERELDVFRKTIRCFFLSFSEDGITMQKEREESDSSRSFSLYISKVSCVSLKYLAA